MKTTLVLWVLIFHPVNSDPIAMPTSFSTKLACVKKAGYVNRLREKHELQPIGWRCMTVARMK